MTRQLLYKLLTLALVLLTFDSLFVSCKKYSGDDRRYLFKSPIKRLSSPTHWDIKAYYINGADSTQSLSNGYSPSMPHGVYFGVISNTKTSIQVKSVPLGPSTWTLIDNKNKLNISINPPNGYSNPFIYNNTNWDIKELDEKVLKISATINGTNYVIIFRN